MEPKKKEKKITNGMKVSFYIPRELHEKMRKIAEESDASIAFHYRKAVKEYIDKQQVNKE